MDALIERFIAVWGTPERGQRLWREWQTKLGAGGGLIDNLAESEADARGIAIEEAQNLLALEKFAHDRGPAYVAKILQQHDADALRATHTFQPMAAAARKKKS